MAAPRILCVQLNPAVDLASEADSVHPTHKIRTRNETAYPGGGSINVARTIRLLGGSPELAFLSGGVVGRWLEELLSPLGLRQQSIRIAGHTRLSHTVLETRTGQEYRFVPPGPEISAHEFDQLSSLVERFDGDYLVLSGSLPPGMPADTYTSLASLAERRGVRVVLDSSGEALAHATANARIHLLKPSFSELEHLAATNLDEVLARRFCRAMVATGRMDNVAVSMGSHGAFLVSREGEFHAPALRVNVRSAVGAGDSFLAAMVHRLTLGDSIDQAFVWGIAAGAASVMSEGTGLNRADDVNELLPRCRVERLASEE
jgi:6-phosphofructokinase 2